jgi:hypothetical protein
VASGGGGSKAGGKSGQGSLGSEPANETSTTVVGRGRTGTHGVNREVIAEFSDKRSPLILSAHVRLCECVCVSVCVFGIVVGFVGIVVGFVDVGVAVVVVMVVDCLNFNQALPCCRRA